MNKGDDCFPKFFKVYLPDDSGDDLELPISFNSYIPKSFPKNVIVRSIYGNVWKMALRKCGGDVEKYVMVNGWKRIVKDEDLKGGEFLAFEFDGSRFFNFCIYGERTCKRLGSLVRTKEVKDDVSDGEEDGRSSDDIIVLDDDDDDDDEEDDDDDQDYGDEEKCNEDIIVLDDDEDDDDDDDDDGDDDDHDDDDDDEDYGDEDNSNEDIIVLDDDDDDDEVDDNDQDYGHKEKPNEDIIVLDDDDDDDDQDYGGDDLADDENERRREETERKEKGSSGVYIKSDGEDDRQYLDNDMNPFFVVNHNQQSKTYTRIPAQVINDYGLRFPEFIYLIDPLEKKCGKLKRKVEGQNIKGFESIIRRNQVKSSDKMICELFREMNGLVCEIKVHVIRG